MPYYMLLIKQEVEDTLLTCQAIKAAVAEGDIEITPFDEKFIGPHSIDIHLDNELLTYGQTADDYEKYHDQVILDTRKTNNTMWTQINSERGIVLKPGVLYLGSTIESVYSRKYAWQVDGRSSIGRLGLSVHSTAGYGDVGFRGNITLELSVIQPVVVYPGLRIGQLSFLPLTGEISLYRGKYQDSDGVIPSRSSWPEG